MATYRAMVILDITLQARDEGHAKSLLNMGRWPDGVACGPPDIRLKRLGTPDKRLIAHLPNCPKAQLQRMLSALGPRRLLIVAMCVDKPQHYSAMVQTIVDNPAFRDNTKSSDVAVDIAFLKNDGWLAQVSHNIELSPVGSPDVVAAFSALAQGN